MECGGKRSATPLLPRHESGVALRLPPHSIESRSGFYPTGSKWNFKVMACRASRNRQTGGLTHGGSAFERLRGAHA